MKIDTFPRFFFGFGRHEKLPPFGKFRRPAETFLFFCGDVTQAPHALCPNPPIPPYGAGLRSGRWDSFRCGEQPLNILEVVGLRAPTAVETCHWHVSKSRLSNPTFGVKNKDHPDGWSLFWRRRWDSNPRGVLPPTRFRVRVAIRTLKENGGNSRTMREFANP